MKIREGLVSNSSSSSYFFRVKDLKINDFVDMMISNYWFESFNKGVLNQEIKDKIKKALEDHKKRSKTYSHEKTHLKPSKSLFEIMDKFHKDYILACKKDLAELDECSTNRELVEFVLKYKRIETKISKEGIEFSYFTSMHNDFRDGMDDLLKEIIMHFCFDTNYKVEFEREDNNNENPKCPKTKGNVLKENFLKEVKK